MGLLVNESEFNVNCLISFAGHYLNALNMRDGESSSFPSATQPLNPNNPYSPDGKSLLTVETHLRTDDIDGMCITRLCLNNCLADVPEHANIIFKIRYSDWSAVNSFTKKLDILLMIKYKYISRSLDIDLLDKKNSIAKYNSYDNSRGKLMKLINYVVRNSRCNRGNVCQL